MILEANEQLKLIKLPKRFNFHLGKLTDIHKKEVANTLKTNFLNR